MSENKYRVQDDAAINSANFSNVTKEEKELKEEVEKWSQKSRVACIILSIIHCHYFYVGRVGRGLLCLFTANFLYIGMIIDWILILSNKFKDNKGKIVNEGRRMAAESKLREFYRLQANR